MFIMVNIRFLFYREVAPTVKLRSYKRLDYAI